MSWLSAVAATAEHGYDSAQRFAERDRQPLDARAERARLVDHTSKGADYTLVFDMPAAMMDPETDRRSAAVVGSLMDLAKVYENSKDAKDYPAGTSNHRSKTC